MLSIFYFPCKVLPIIDEHNRMRQNVLGLERKYLAKGCWFHLLVNATGSSVVDMHRWCRNLKQKGTHNVIVRSRQFETINFETEFDYEIEVTKFS